MNATTIGTWALITLLAGGPAWALRGVDPGATCKRAEQVESKLGSNRRGSSSRDAQHTLIFFDGSYLGESALISYSCESGSVVTQQITVKLTHENEARLTFADFKRALTIDHGEPFKDVDEPTISDMKKDAYPGELPTERFVVWVLEKRVISLMLSGRESSWELVVAGP